MAGAAPPPSGRAVAIASAAEREHVRAFWRALTQRERRGLVDAEHRTVLARLHEFQRAACTCGVCTRKRGAIEAKLGELYDMYYVMLESHAQQAAARACPSSSCGASSSSACRGP